MIKRFFNFFLLRYLVNPRQVGSLFQSSKSLSKSISSIINELGQTRVVEIGPGKGSITRLLSKENLILVEIDNYFVDHLRLKFPQLTIHQICAIDFLENLDDQVGLVVSIPLINNPIKPKFVSALKRLYLNKKIKWCLIYTYGKTNPLAEIGFSNQNMVKKVYLNFPPAYIWLYK